MNKVTQWALNLSAGLFFFIFFLFLFFPFETFIKNSLSQIEKQSGGAYRVTFKEINPNILFKSVIKDLEIRRRTGNQEEVLVHFPEFRIGVKYLALLGDELKGSFEASNKNGGVEGDFDLESQKTSVEINFDQFNLKHLPGLEIWTHVPITGQISGLVKAVFVKNQINQHTLSAELKFEKLKLPASKLEPVQGFELELPEMDLAATEPFKIQMKLEKGTLDIKQFHIPGPDVKVNLSGNIRLNPRFALSRLDVNGDFFLSEKVEKAIPLIVVLEKQKGENGLYPLNLSGRISEPSVKIGTFSPF